MVKIKRKGNVIFFFFFWERFLKPKNIVGNCMHLSPFHNMSTHLAKEIAISGDGISCTRSIQDFCHRQCLFFFLKKIQKLFDFILLQRNSEGTEKLHNVWKLFSINPIFPTIMTSFAPSPSSNASAMPIEFLHSYLHHYHIKCMENLFINVNQSYQFASKSDLSLKPCCAFTHSTFNTSSGPLNSLV